MAGLYENRCGSCYWLRDCRDDFKMYDELYYEGRACWNLLDAEDYKNIIEYYKRKHRKL